MKKLLNTLFVLTQGAYLSRSGETVLVQADDRVLMRVPIHTLDGILCFGRVVCSAPVMHLCAERSVTVSFLSEHGRFWARVQGPISGNVLLRRRQHRWADDEERSLEIARNIVAAKIVNCRAVILRTARDHPQSVNSTELNQAAAELARIGADVAAAANLERLRGHEGEAARTYFGIFDHLIVSQKDEFRFHDRTRRPPLDPMNALLSFLYTMLTHDMVSALEGVGLDPAVGYLHCDRPGRPSLALDLIEEFRPFIADRLALSLVNRRQVASKGFKTTETGAVLMDEGTRKVVLTALQKRKQEEIKHPFLEEKMPLGLVPYSQALLLARFLRGDLDGYPPFVWR